METAEEVPVCDWCKKPTDKCACNEALACGVENPKACETCT